MNHILRCMSLLMLCQITYASDSFHYDSPFTQTKIGLYNRLGSWVGRNISSSLGFGDLHKTTQLLINASENQELKSSFSRLNAHEQTAAAFHAQKKLAPEKIDEFHQKILRLSTQDQKNTNKVVSVNKNNFIVVHQIDNDSINPTQLSKDSTKNANVTQAVSSATKLVSTKSNDSVANYIKLKELLAKQLLANIFGENNFESRALSQDKVSEQYLKQAISNYQQRKETK